MTKPRVEPWIAELVRADIEAAIADKDVGSLRNFAAEAEASSMAEDAERAFEVASMLESWEAKSARAELARIKAAAAPTPPTQSDLIRSFNELVFNTAPPFDRTESPDLERRRVEEQNRALAERDRVFEAQRAQAVPDEPEPEPWWRR